MYFMTALDTDKQDTKRDNQWLGLFRLCKNIFMMMFAWNKLLGFTHFFPPQQR